MPDAGSCRFLTSGWGGAVFCKLLNIMYLQDVKKSRFRMGGYAGGKFIIKNDNNYDFFT